MKQTIDFLPNKTDDKFWVIEGAGGILVPLNEKDLMLDLMQNLRLPVVIAARAGLGTINHTLLTIEALRSHNLEIIGVMMNGEPNLENKRAIEHYGNVSVLAEVPKLENLNAESLKSVKINLEIKNA